MGGIKACSVEGCYDEDFVRRAEELFPDDTELVKHLGQGSECVGEILRKKTLMPGEFVHGCLESGDPKKMAELKEDARKADAAEKLYAEWRQKYRAIFWKE